MFQFIETIQVFDGEVLHLEWHQKRLNQTFSAYYPNQKPINLSERYKNLTLPKKGKYKDRILYNQYSFKAELKPYTIKKINLISFVEADFDYSFKYLDRKRINEILEKSNTDDVVFLKNNYVTDSSYSNLVFFKANRWFTPNTYLLNGSCRQRLIHEKKITEAEIKIDNILNYEKIGFINAMIDLNELILPIN